MAKSAIGGTNDPRQGERVFHQKFATASPPIDGTKLTIDFEKAGPKRVLDSFVERH